MRRGRIRLNFCRNFLVYKARKILSLLMKTIPKTEEQKTCKHKYVYNEAWGGTRHCTACKLLQLKINGRFKTVDPDEPPI